MGASDKISAGMENLKGKAKEAAGKMRGDDEQIAEGKADQAEAKLKDAAADAKDAAKNAADKAKGAAKDVFDE